VDELLTRGEKVGVLKVRLYRPFSAKHLLSRYLKPRVPLQCSIVPKSRVRRLNPLSGRDDRSGGSL
jgi:hypothetical protein